MSIDHADREGAGPISNGPETEASRAPNGRFAPGNPGGPGRPKGARHAALLALDAIGEEGAADVLGVVLQAARGGDLRAAALLLDRVWPARKGRAVEVALPPVASAADLVPALAAVAGAMARGELTPEEARAMAGVLGSSAGPSRPPSWSTASRCSRSARSRWRGRRAGEPGPRRARGAAGGAAGARGLHPLAGRSARELAGGRAGPLGAPDGGGGRARLGGGATADRRGPGVADRVWVRRCRGGGGRGRRRRRARKGAVRPTAAMTDLSTSGCAPSQQ
jgi:hypothetical protein